MVGYIYLITDTTNGMKYTGKHHYHIEGQLDPNYHGSGVIIKNIYKKRPETLKEEYIKTCYSEEEMCSDEQYYIKFFKTLWPYGYNLTEGGDGWSGGPCEETRRKLSEIHKNISDETRRKMSLSRKGRTPYNKGKHLSEEHKKKIGASNKGKTLSEEARKKISESNSGEKHHFFGKHHTEETKKKLSDAHKGKHLSDETKKKIGEKSKGRNHTEESKKKISTANKGKNRSEETKQKISEVKKKLYSSGMKHPMLGKHHTEETKKKMSENHWDCSGENHYMFGKHHSEETKKKISNTKKGIPNEKQSKKVLQYTLDDEFVREWSSIAECSRNGYDGANICLCCQGKRKSHKGFKWCYA